MGKLMSAIRFLLASDENLTLENRLFVSSILVAGGITIISNFLGTLLGVSGRLLVIGYISLALLGVIYFFARIKGIFKPFILVFVLLSLLVNAGLFVFGGGIDSQNMGILFLTLVLSLVIVSWSAKPYILIGYIVLVLILYLVQLYFPEWIKGYNSKMERWMDGLSTNLYTLFFFFLITNFLLRNYSSEKQKAENSERNLQDLNNSLETRISERTRELELKNHVLKIAGENALFGVWSYETVDKKLDWSQEVKKIHEVPEDYFPVLERDLAFFMPEYREKVRGKFLNCMMEGKSFDEILQINTFKQQLIWVRFTGEAERDGHGRVERIIGSFQNIDFIMKAEKEIETARLEADIANAAKSRFLLNVSHEFRTPLNAVIGYAELLESGDGNNIPEFAGLIKSDGRRLLDMVNKIIELIRTEKAEIELEEDYFDPCRFFLDFERVFAGMVSEKGIRFRIALVDELPSLIYADEKRIHLAIGNMIDNAIKFTDHGEVEMKVYLQPNPAALSQETIDLIIEIRDSGIGITAEFQDKIFEAFAKGDQDSGFGGVGIGLSLTHRIVSKMGGNIKVMSQTGIGSRFTVTLPDLACRFGESETRFSLEPEQNSNPVVRIPGPEAMDLPGLLAALEGRFYTIWEGFEAKQPLGEVERFARELVDLAANHHCNHLMEYGNQLIDSVDSFDVEGMLGLLKRYHGIIEMLKGDHPN